MKSQFIVMLHEVPVTRQFAIGAPLVADALAGLVQREALGLPSDDPRAGEGRLAIEMMGNGDTVVVRGRLTGHMHVACSRCVTEVRLPLDEEILATYMPKGFGPATDGENDEEVEVTADELDVFEYENEQLDLEPLIREQFILGVPYAPLCREDCRGLCGQCGTDQNTSTCECKPLVDPSFSPLSGLKLPS